jgi:phosphoglycolate phosphatase
MIETNCRTIFFDLDGTLVDSAPDLATSVNHALAIIDKPPIDDDTLRSYIGNGADRLIHRAISGDFHGTASEAEYSPARESFLAHYANNVCEKSQLYPTVIETLEILVSQEYELACITNKPAQFTSPLLESLEIHQFFALTLSGDTLAKKKPAPDQLLFAAEHFGRQPESCLMVGDTTTDISAALNCNAPSVYVTYGYGQTSDLDERFTGPHIDKLAELHLHL